MPGTAGTGGKLLCGELVSAGLWGDGTLETLETLGTGGSVLGAGSVTGTVGAGGISLCGELASAGL